jgi:hypothetical protein
MAGKARVTRQSIEQADMVALLGQPAFRRFLFRFGVACGMWAETNGSDERHLRIAEGRRSLGFEVFRWADDAVSLTHPSGIPVSTLVAVLREEIQPQGAIAHDESDPASDDDEPDGDVRRV